MLRLLNLEEIESLLLRIPEIIRQFEQREMSVVMAVNDWLSNAEQILTKNRMAMAAEVAVLRGTLIAGERGFSNEEEPPSKGLTRKMKEARAAVLLRRATEIVSDAIRLRRLQVSESQRIVMQIVAVANQLGLVSPELGQNHTAYLEMLKQTISSRAELISLIVHVLGIVGNSDFLVLLDRAITTYSVG